MSIHYSLYENPLTTDPDDYNAKVSSIRTANLDDVISRMVERGSTVTRADIISVMEDFEHALKSLLIEGSNINLPFANYSASIKGVFKGPADKFDPARHKAAVNVHTGKKIKDFFSKNAVCEKVQAILPTPNLIDFIDLSTGERNSIVTPANMGQILGSRLKFDSEVNEEGIYFIAADNTEVKVSVIGKNKPGELMFLIPPELAAGDYILEVRASFGDSVRTGRLNAVLSIA